MSRISYIFEILALQTLLVVKGFFEKTKAVIVIEGAVYSYQVQSSLQIRVFSLP